MNQQTYGQSGAAAGPISGADSRAIFAQTMFLVAVTVAFAAAGAWLARDASSGVVLPAYIGSFGILIGMRFARRTRSGSLGMGLLFGFGLLLGIAIGPTLAVYARSPDGPTILWQACLLTGLFVAGFGCAGYATKRDLAPAMRVAFFALIGLIVAGFILAFVSMPAINIVWSLVALAVFSVFTMFYFQRLRTAGEEDVVMLAMGIFITIFNIFLIILQLMGGGGRR